MPYPSTEAASEANRHYAAERAVNDPVKLAKAARIFRIALERGLVTPEGDLVDQDEQ